VVYHVNTIPVKDNENKRTRNASVLANSPNCAKNWPMCSRVFFLGHPKILRIRVSWFPVGMGGDQIGCHKVSDMIAPMDHAYFELISECPAIFSLTISMAAGARPPALWLNIGGVGWILACCLSPPLV
jgi:hypothetical protein